MADNIKIIGNISDIQRISRIDVNDQNILNPQILPQNFGFKEDYIELFVYSLTNELLYTDTNYQNYKSSPNYGLINETISIIEIDPINDLKSQNFISGQFRSQYNFFKRTLLDPSNNLFIQQISDDRTELRINSTTISSVDLISKGQSLIDDLFNSSTQKYFLLNQDNNYQNLIINIAIDSNSPTPTILLKLYKPIPLNVDIKSILWITEEITEPYIFGIDLDTSIIPPDAPKLKGPNFDVDIDFKQNISTRYENYNSLISSLSGSSYAKTLNYSNDKSYDLNIDYTSFENFIHFSSAKKRLEIFYYKTKQIENYFNNINILTGSSAVLKNEETASIKLKVDNITSNFDGFENYLYYESSSYAWPKQGSNKPYLLLSTSSAAVISWYNNYIDSATDYDNNNLDYLYYTIPNFVKNDPTNYQSYYDFIDMIGHYFDNVWIYITSINELYNADNNLEKGVSKDIVYDALKSLGIKLYNSKGNNEFNDYVGGLNTGSTLFSNDFSATSSYLNNIPKKDLLSELYKRIYHNIPLLSKTKGTKAGLQNLITTFGITSSIFEPKEFGGSNSRNQIKGYDNDKITIQNNTITGSVLSPFISVQQSTTSSNDFTSTDLHFVDLSFSPQNQLNSRVSASITLLNPTFSLDDYIGDPRLMRSSSYDDLINQQNYFISASSAISGSAQRLDYKGFFELVKYFDNSLFKMLKDFVPARANTLTGITIKSPVLERNKIAVYQPDVTEKEIHEANYNTPVVSEDRDYYYDKISGNKSSFYNGELIGSYANINNLFENSNPNPYLHPLRPIDINRYSRSDFNVYLNNISSSVLSTSRKKLETLYLTSGKYIFSLTGSASELTSSAAELQDSYEDLSGHQNSRYDGTKIYSLKYNEYSTASLNYEGDKSFGKTSVIDYNTNKLGLFTSIDEDVFFKIKKNNVYLKYLVDKDGNLTELNKYNKHWEEVQNIFKGGTKLTVAQFDTQQNNNQKNTDGIKPIYNSGYNYTPMLYFTGSGITNRLYFSYSGEDTLKLFKAGNTVNGFISGSGNGNEKYPLKPSGSVKVIYNTFNEVIVNDSLLYTTGSSTSNQFPSYSVPSNGNYSFNTNFDINVKFQTTNQSCSFKYDVIKGSLGVDGFPYGTTIATSGVKTFTTSYVYGVYAKGENVIPEGATIINSTAVNINSTYFPLYVGDNLLLTYNSSNIYKDSSNTSWYSHIVSWDNRGAITTSLIFSKNVFSEFFSNDDLITTVDNVDSIFAPTEGLLSFIVNSDSDKLLKDDKIYFKLLLLGTSTPNFTASFKTSGELKNGLTSNVIGDAVFATGTQASSFITNAITSSNNGGINTLVFNEELSAFNDYTFLPNTGSIDLLRLYNNYGEVNDTFSPTTGDVVIAYWDKQSTEFNISNVFFSSSYKCLTLDRNIPNSLVNKITDGNNSSPAGIDEFILLKKNKDETNLLLTFNKPSGNSSLGFIIPDNIHPDVLANIDVITKEVKQKLLENGTSGGPGTF
jgi:hypothetical protein